MSAAQVPNEFLPGQPCPYCDDVLQAQDFERPDPDMPQVVAVVTVVYCDGCDSAFTDVPAAIAAAEAWAEELKARLRTLDAGALS